MRVYAIVNVTTRGDHSLGETLDEFLHRDDAERFVEDVRASEPELADELRIVEHELKVPAPARTSRR